MQKIFVIFIIIWLNEIKTTELVGEKLETEEQDLVSKKLLFTKEFPSYFNMPA